MTPQQAKFIIDEVRALRRERPVEEWTRLHELAFGVESFFQKKKQKTTVRLVRPPKRRNATENAIARGVFLRNFYMNGNVALATAAAGVCRGTPHKWAKRFKNFRCVWDKYREDIKERKQQMRARVVDARFGPALDTDRHLTKMFGVGKGVSPKTNSPEQQEHLRILLEKDELERAAWWNDAKDYIPGEFGDEWCYQKYMGFISWRNRVRFGAVPVDSETN